MQAVFDVINVVCTRIAVVSDLFWAFPTNFSWYAGIPVIGNFSLAIILLLGSGIFFSFRLRFVQVRYFKKGLRILMKEKQGDTGVSPLASFLLSTAMRVGPGNIIGVTGAIAAGGPGALFWMWVSAFFGMATSFTESTMAQIFKEKKGDEYIGGLAFYGRRLIKGSVVAGVLLSVVYILYALLCFPAQGFNTISAVGQIAEVITGNEQDTNSPLYWVSFAVMICFVAFITFGGIKKVTKTTDVLVPVMAVIYILTVLVLIVINFDRIPWFFSAVFKGAFRPEAVFGGTFGMALVQGVKRGLMSNEAGQGTITMAAAASNKSHPCEQGCVQCLGVFLDTIVICTMSGFVVIMGRAWLTVEGKAWMAMDNLPKFLGSAAELTPGAGFNTVVTLLIAVCFGLFAFTPVLGFTAFTEICANRISTGKAFINTIRLLSLFVISFGVMTSIAGMDLGALWNLSDFANIVISYCNIPLLYVGFKYVKRAEEHFRLNDGTAFSSDVVGIKVDIWDELADAGEK